MRIAVIGAGALGSLFAGLLGLVAEKFGNEIWLVGQTTSQESLKAIAEKGLVIELAPGVNENWPLSREYLYSTSKFMRVSNVKVAKTPSEVSEQVDLALVLVKSYRTPAAAEQARSILKDEGLAITLQNGLGNAEQLAKILGTDRVSQGVTSLGATLLEAGRVRFAGLGQTAIGIAPDLNPERANLLNGLVECLKALALPVVSGQDVSGLVWGKLVVNCAINPLTALLRCPNGRLLEKAGSLELLDAAANEAAMVASAKAINLPFPASEAAEQARKVAALTAGNTSSMLADILRGRQTEIEAINGALVREGEKTGIPTPVNRTLYLLIKALETKN
ncbi:MAG TPA: ketopantoate reductase family protein [Chloroflexia bacterium]|nr:ketopantoate reductase family protein [Chloroflexia bacterium]